MTPFPAHGLLGRLSRLLRLHPARLLVAPRLEAPADASAGGNVELRVHGMVCALCAMRTNAAFLATPGVEAANVDLEAGTARVRLSPGVRLDAVALQRSLDAVVIALPARRAVERLARRASGQARAAMIAEGQGR